MKKRLEEIEKERHVQRQSRKDLFKVALVGYTNAGKSTLLNALTHSDVLAEDKLFATLDSSVRAISPNTRPPIVAIDTVGFISRIPPTLVASFRSTLEELHEADLLLHVVDGSSQEAKEQHQTTEQVLVELGLEHKPRLVVINKMDLVPSTNHQVRILVPGATRLSAFDSEQVQVLKSKIMDYFTQHMSTFEVLIPYTEPKLEALIYSHAQIEIKRYLDKGVFLRFKMDPAVAKKYEIERFEK